MHESPPFVVDAAEPSRSAEPSGLTRRGLVLGAGSAVMLLAGACAVPAAQPLWLSTVPVMSGGAGGSRKRASVGLDRSAESVAAPEAASGEQLGPSSSQPQPQPQPAGPAAPGPVLATRPPVVRRRAWCERQLAANHSAMGQVERITVHHTGVDTRALGASDLQTVQRIEDYHRDERGWACIGYHFLIAADGTVYEGRPLNVQGAHVRESNSGNIGVAVIGDCHRAEPSAGQVASLRWLLQGLATRFGIQRGSVYGHRELGATTCPGDCLFAWVMAWRAEQRAAESIALIESMAVL